MFNKMEVFKMKMTKFASKCAAVLCAMAVMVPAAAVAVPGTSVFSSNAIVASAAVTDFQYQGNFLTGDLFCKAGESFTMTVTLGAEDEKYGLDGFTYEWYYAPANSDNWTQLSYTTKSITLKMSTAFNGAHIKAVKVNKTTGEKKELPVRTVSCTEITASLGVPTYDGDNWLKVPVYVKGALKNQISSLGCSLVVNPNVFDDCEFEFDCDTGDVDQSFSAYPDPDEAGVYNHITYTVMKPNTVNSYGLYGYFYVHAKDMSKVNGQTLKLRARGDSSVTGEGIDGNIIYGVNFKNTTVDTSLKALYPSVQTQVKDHKIGFKWNAIDGAEKYGIAVFQANKWVVKKQVDGNVTSWTSPQVGNGTYKMAVCAKVNGEWVKDNINQHTFNVTVK